MSLGSMRIGVTYGLRGYFAVLYDTEGAIQSGIGSYETEDGAKEEAYEWSCAEGVPLDFNYLKGPNP